MVLKLLTLSDDEVAKAKLHEFENILLDYLESINGLNREQYISDHPEFLNHPLWGTYTVNIGDKGALASQTSLLYEIMSERYGIGLHPQPLRMFGQYAFTVSPQLRTTWGNLVYVGLDNLNYYHTSQHAPSAELLTVLDEQYKTTDQNNCYDLMTIGERYAEVAQYGKAIKILEDALKKVGDSPFRFYILFQMVNVMLESGEEENLPKMKEYFNSVAQEFERIQDNELDTFYIYTVGEGEEKKTITNSSGLHIYDILELKVAVDIANGNFDAAYQCLKQYDLTSNTDLDSKALKVAIQSQLPNIPKKLLKLLAKELTRANSKESLERPFMRRELDEFEDMYTEFLKKRKKKAYKKVMQQNKENFAQWNVQPEKPSFEGKGKNPKEDSASSEEDLAVSKKKSNKKRSL